MRAQSCLPPPSCLSLLLAALLAQGATAAAETPLTDPVAPAVIGRPLDQIGPLRKPAARPPAARPAAARPAPPRPATASKGAVGRAGATAAAPPAVLGGPAGEASDAPQARVAKRAVDDRADPRMRLDDVGKGSNLARKPLGPGAYFGSKHRAAVRKYYEQQPAPPQPVNWQIGEPVPRGAPVRAVPQPLRVNLPKLPPGHRYLQVGGEVLLVAAGSGMVVDGISRTER